MNVMTLRGTNGIDSVALEDRPEPRPGFGQVLIRVHAVSLNYRDLLIVRGVFPFSRTQASSLILASDGVGTITAVGDGVTRFQVGDRVSPIFAQSWLVGRNPPESFFASQLGGPLDGMLADFVVFDQERVVAVPDHLSDAEAATLPCAGVTAWNALVGAGNLVAGETVLVQGTGGVSLFAAQFAKLAGARVIVTSGSDAKLEKARALGAWETINYRTVPQWGERVRELTNGVGADHVLEVGGTDTFEQSLDAVKFGGKIYVVGFLSGLKVGLDFLRQLQRQTSLIPIAVGSREMFEAMNRAIDVHRLKPVVDRVFPLAEIAEALRHLESGSHFGKIVISLT